MSSAATRTRWLIIHEQLEARAEAFKDSQSVAFGMLEAYDSLSTEERADILPIVAEWFVSENNKLRYDAAFLTGERRIRELAPAVRDAIIRAERIPGPEARDEVETLRRLQEELGGR